MVDHEDQASEMPYSLQASFDESKQEEEGATACRSVINRALLFMHSAYLLHLLR